MRWCRRPCRWSSHVSGRGLAGGGPSVVSCGGLARSVFPISSCSVSRQWFPVVKRPRPATRCGGCGRGGGGHAGCHDDSDDDSGHVAGLLMWATSYHYHLCPLCMIVTLWDYSVGFDYLVCWWKLAWTACSACRYYLGCDTPNCH